MVIDSADLAGSMRESIRRFLRTDFPSRREVVRVIRHIESMRWASYFFGGFPRDLLLGRPGSRPRDIDIVTALATQRELETSLAEWIVYRNRFGGLKLRAGEWDLDVWCADSTWAVREFPLFFQGVGSLPRTTFLNVESILVSVYTELGDRRNIVECGFFRAIADQCVDVVLGENPFPALCIARSLLLAKKLGFDIGPGLLAFLSHYRHKVRVEDVMNAQVQHYGRVRIHRESLVKTWNDAVTAYHGGKQRLRLPTTKEEQLRLWDYEQPLEPVEPDARLASDWRNVRTG